MIRRAPTLRRTLLLPLIALTALALAITVALSLLSLRAVTLSQLDSQLQLSLSRIGVAEASSVLPATTKGRDEKVGRDHGRKPVGVPDVLHAPGLRDGTVVVVSSSQLRAGLIGPDGKIRQLTTAQVAPIIEEISKISTGVDGPKRSSESASSPHYLRLPGLGDYRVLIVATDGTARAVGLSLEPTQALIWRVAAWSAGIGLIILLGLWWLISRRVRSALEPLEQVRVAAGRVSALPLENGRVKIEQRAPSLDPQTELGQVSQALNRMLDHVESALEAREQSQEQLRQFISDASHELRTPLASILGYAQLLEREMPSPANSPQREHLARIESEGARMNRIVNQLLAVARLENGCSPQITAVDMLSEITQVRADAQAAYPDHDWKIDLLIWPEDPQPVVSADADLTRQVLLNLVSNVGRHTPAGTTATLSLAVDETRVMVTVSDDGPGIDPQVRDRIFERFARGHADTAGVQGGGSGLGLSISRQIATSLGGSLELLSGDAAEGGAAFRLALPLWGG